MKEVLLTRTILVTIALGCMWALVYAIPQAVDHTVCEYAKQTQLDPNAQCEDLLAVR